MKQKHFIIKIRIFPFVLGDHVGFKHLHNLVCTEFDSLFCKKLIRIRITLPNSSRRKQCDVCRSNRLKMEKGFI